MKSTLKGFTLIEILLVIAISTLSLQLFIPQWKKSAKIHLFQKEQQHLYAFFRQQQARSENSRELYFLIAQRNSIGNQWCITAQLKSSQICDCFNPSLCPSSLSPQFYYPLKQGKSMIFTKQYFPQNFTKFNGNQNTSLTNCLVLQVNQHRAYFSFFNEGTLRIKNEQNITGACKNYDI